MSARAIGYSLAFVAPFWLAVAAVVLALARTG